MRFAAHGPPAHPRRSFPPARLKGEIHCSAGRRIRRIGPVVHSTWKPSPIDKTGLAQRCVMAVLLLCTGLVVGPASSIAFSLPLRAFVFKPAEAEEKKEKGLCDK